LSWGDLLPAAFRTQPTIPNLTEICPLSSEMKRVHDWTDVTARRRYTLCSEYTACTDYVDVGYIFYHVTHRNYNHSVSSVIVVAFSVAALSSNTENGLKTTRLTKEC
jgi:hypothetical protein